MNEYDIVVRPIITEKSTLLKDAGNQYVFEVQRAANKIEIKKAVEKIFNVKVLRVNTINVKSKPKRLGKSTGFSSKAKKAIVTVSAKDKIDFFESTV